MLLSWDVALGLDRVMDHCVDFGRCFVCRGLGKVVFLTRCRSTARYVATFPRASWQIRPTTTEIPDVLGLSWTSVGRRVSCLEAMCLTVRESTHHDKNACFQSVKIFDSVHVFLGSFGQVAFDVGWGCCQQCLLDD